MSHRLEYQWTAFHVPAASLGMTDDRFVIAIEGGDNNVCDARTGKRSRSWNVGMIGSRAQVLRQAVRVAGACEGGSPQPLGRRCTPETYVRRIRALLDGPLYPAKGQWRARLRVHPDHPRAGRTLIRRPRLPDREAIRRERGMRRSRHRPLAGFLRAD
jgi:hypothetical protein